MNESKPSNPKAEKTSPPEVMMQVLVLKDGTIVNGAKCGKTLITATTKSNALALEEIGRVQIIGVA